MTNRKLGKDGTMRMDRRTLIKGAGVLGAGIATGTLGAPAVWGQGKKTIRFLNTETSIDSIRALKVACAEYEKQFGTQVIVVGFPLGFYDTVHRLPVARQAAIASAFGVRFQGEGYFLTDARTHRGTSGAPVVLHDPQGGHALPWKLLGIHSGRLDMSTRQPGVDESLGLNCAW